MKPHRVFITSMKGIKKKPIEFLEMEMTPFRFSFVNKKGFHFYHPSENETLVVLITKQKRVSFLPPYHPSENETLVVLIRKQKRVSFLAPV